MAKLLYLSIFAVTAINNLNAMKRDNPYNLMIQGNGAFNFVGNSYNGEDNGNGDNKKFNAIKFLTNDENVIENVRKKLKKNNDNDSVMQEAKCGIVKDDDATMEDLDLGKENVEGQTIQPKMFYGLLPANVVNELRSLKSYHMNEGQCKRSEKKCHKEEL